MPFYKNTIWKRSQWSMLPTQQKVTGASLLPPTWTPSLSVQEKKHQNSQQTHTERECKRVRRDVTEQPTLLRIHITAANLPAGRLQLQASCDFKPKVNFPPPFEQPHSLRSFSCFTALGYFIPHYLNQKSNLNNRVECLPGVTEGSVCWQAVNGDHLEGTVSWLLFFFS